MTRLVNLQATEADVPKQSNGSLETSALLKSVAYLLELLRNIRKKALAGRQDFQVVATGYTRVLN